jgi:allophanate hydrolase subunit 2
MFYHITKEAVIKKGAQLKTGTSNFGSRKGGKIQMNKESLAIFQNELSVYKGPEYELLSSESREQLTELIFALSAFNRMGIALDPILEPHTHKMITGPVLPGTVQLTPSGRLFVLMRDCQTTGGYPRVLQLTQSAINALGQKKTGDKIRFLLE